MKYGVQMYSLRDMTPTDMAGAIRSVAESGYSFVEFAGWFGHTAEELRTMLDENHVTAEAAHIYTNELTDSFDETVRILKTLGCKRFVVPEFGMKTREGLEEFIRFCAEYAPRLRAEGIELFYHNHRYEFQPTEDGFVVMDELAKRCDVLFELDTYWCWVAGADPLQYARLLGDRLKLIHLKDGDRSGKGSWLGKGSAPIADVLRYAHSNGIKVIVESEGLVPSGKEEVRGGMDWLRTFR